MGLLVFLLLVGGCRNEKEDIKGPEKPLLTIIHTNDIHGVIEGAGGLAQVATYIKKYKEEHIDENIMVVDAGDLNRRQVYDEITCGSLIFKIVDTIGYDYLTLGNHELNYGYNYLMRNVESLKFSKMLNANVKLVESNERLFLPYDVFEIEGVKVGIYSVLTDGNLYNYPNLSKVTVDDPYLETEKVLRDLRREKVDIVIGLVHLAVLADGEGRKYIHNDYLDLEGIDLIIDGHDHEICPSNQTGCYYEYPMVVRNAGQLEKGIGITKIWYSENGISISEEKISVETINGNDPEILNESMQDWEVMAIYNEVRKEYDRVLGHNHSDLTKEQFLKQENHFSNMVADAYRHAADSDIALVPGWNFKENVAQGNVSLTTLFEVIEHSGNWNQADNIVVVNVRGKDIKKMMKRSLRFLPKGDRDFLHFSGMEITYKVKKNKHRRKIKRIMVNEEKLKPKQLYSVAMPMSLYRNRWRYSVLKKYKIEKQVGVDYLLVAEYIEKFGINETMSRLIKE